MVPTPIYAAVADTLAREAQFENTGCQLCSLEKNVIFINLTEDEDADKAPEDKGEDKDKEAEEEVRGAEGETDRAEKESSD